MYQPATTKKLRIQGRCASPSESLPQATNTKNIIKVEIIEKAASRMSLIILNINKNYI